MKVIFEFILLMSLGLLAEQPSAAAVNVIPQPDEVREMPGKFVLGPQTVFTVDGENQGAKAAADQLAQFLRQPLGVVLDVKTEKPRANAIFFTARDANPKLGIEGYQLVVQPDQITIRAAGLAGFFYATQTLRQLLPIQVEKAERLHGISLSVPCMEITDAPRYPWRGMMLDVARHYFDKEQVEHVLDVMALHKLNRFHWHLSDDQGWRIEIKKYPNLTDIGAWRDGIGFKLDPKRTNHYRRDGKYGGYYTQHDVHEIVAYAAKLHIVVIPEIEMPGHSQAALTAYPEFSCTKKPQGIGMTGGVMDAIYDAGDDGVFAFLDDVLGEVTGLFPGPYIHIGGDEVPKGPWKKSAACQARMRALGLKNEEELQSYFIKRVEKIVESRHRQIIGWDEILEGGLAPGATVMSWRGIDGGIAAAVAGHDVIMTPTSHCYLDYSQTQRKGEQPTIGGHLTLENVYGFDPTPAKLTGEQAAHVLGVQGNLWTEYVPDMSQLEYQAFPRECAIAEVGWSKHDKNFADFSRRLELLKQRLKMMGVHFFEEHEPTSAPAP